MSSRWQQKTEAKFRTQIFITFTVRIAPIPYPCNLSKHIKFAVTLFLRSISSFASGRTAADELFRRYFSFRGSILLSRRKKCSHLELMDSVKVLFTSLKAIPTPPLLAGFSARWAHHTTVDGMDFFDILVYRRSRAALRCFEVVHSIWLSHDESNHR